MRHIWVASANRDERLYEEPDVFRLDRPQPKGHFAFGGGDVFNELIAAVAHSLCGDVLQRIVHPQRELQQNQRGNHGC